jgi:hypothetical protein
VLKLCTVGLVEYGLYPDDVYQTLKGWCGSTGDWPDWDQRSDEWIERKVREAVEAADLDAIGQRFAETYVANQELFIDPCSIVQAPPATAPRTPVDSSPAAPPALTAEQLQKLQAADDASCIDRAPATADKRSDKRVCFKLADFLDQPEPEWLVKDFVIERSTFCVYGQPGCKKTFLALEMALSIATGKQFLDRWEVKSGPIVYIAAEGQGHFKKRFKAWLKHHDQELPNNVYVIPHKWNFLKPDEELAALKTCIDTAVGADKPVMIVCDTLARLFGAGNESSNADMTVFVDFCDQLREYYSASIGIIHHAGKDESRGPRGASNLFGMVDSLIFVESAQGSNIVEISCQKQKDDGEFKPIKLLTNKIDLGQMPDGSPRTSLVLTAAQTPAQQFACLPDQVQELLIKLHDKFADASFGWTEAGKALGYLEGNDKNKSAFQKLFDRAKDLLQCDGPKYRIEPELLTRLKLQLMVD